MTNCMTLRILLISTFAAMSFIVAKAQSPAPIIVPAASAAPVSSSISTTPLTQDSGSLEAALKSLQEIKATNEETLKKQQAALQHLDELQEAAEQMKIFSKRG